VPIFYPNAPVTYPFRTLLQIAVHLKPALAILELDPATRHGRRMKAVEIGNKQRAVPPKDSAHLCDGAVDIRNVDTGQITDHEIERAIGKLDALSCGYLLIGLV